MTKAMDSRRRGGTTDRVVPPHVHTATCDIDVARNNLSRFVNEMAIETEIEIGFTYRIATIAPSTFTDLKNEFRLARITGLPLRVSGAFLEPTIFDSASTNAAGRFWHDTRHVWLGADFTLEGEFAVANAQLCRLIAAGYDTDTIEYRLLEADTLGQTYFRSLQRRFPRNQLRFVRRCLHLDLLDAVAAEVEAETAEGCS